MLNVQELHSNATNIESDNLTFSLQNPMIESSLDEPLAVIQMPKEALLIVNNKS